MKGSFFMAEDVDWLPQGNLSGWGVTAYLPQG